MNGKPDPKVKVVIKLTRLFKESLKGRGNLPRDDLEYVVTTINKLKDERLKECITELIGWGDDQRAELETAAAISIELMKISHPKKIAEAARRVELSYHIKGMKDVPHP